MVNFHGFRNADAAPMTTARTMPIPAPREAPTAAAVKEFSLARESWLASLSIARSRANSNRSLSLASSFKKKRNAGIKQPKKNDKKHWVSYEIRYNSVDFKALQDLKKNNQIRIMKCQTCRYSYGKNIQQISKACIN